MIDCEQVLGMLEAFCDEEVSEARAQVIVEHLGGCPGCLDRRDFRLRLRAIIREKCGTVGECPEDLVRRVRQLVATSGSA